MHQAALECSVGERNLYPTQVVMAVTDQYCQGTYFAHIKKGLSSLPSLQSAWDQDNESVAT